VKVSLDCGELRRWWLRSVFYLDHANLEDVTRLGVNPPQGCQNGTPAHQGKTTSTLPVP